MTTFTNKTVPATVLETMAFQTESAIFPVRIRSNDDCAALAAAGLWTFARQTGLDCESETLQTVLTDFLTNLLHLLHLCDAEGAGATLLQSALQTALIHFEQERRGEDDGPAWHLTV